MCPMGTSAPTKTRTFPGILFGRFGASPDSQHALRQESGDRVAVIDRVGAVEIVVPDRGWRDTQGAIDRGGHVFGALRARCRICAVFVCRADPRPATNTASREKDGLHGAPMVASRTG